MFQPCYINIAEVKYATHGMHILEMAPPLISKSYVYQFDQLV